MQFRLPLPVDRSRLARLGLHTRVSLILTALAASLLLVLAGQWLHGTQASIHEEVEAATRVSEQMLRLLTRDLNRPDELLAVVRPLGRIRAHELEVLAADGRRLYHSPGPTYKAGRQVPGWFAGLLAPEFAPRRLAVGESTLLLTPDPSRALIDAWDDLLAVAGWALVFLALLFLAVRRALNAALRPLAEVMMALDQTGRGRFETRLPVFAAPELARLSRSFNGMADRLQAVVDDNVRLETEREVAARMQAGLEAERRDIARELHDELAQGITAVRALAGAIVQRTADDSALHIPARSIVAVTGEMQDGVRHILHRLRPADASLELRLGRLLDNWRRQNGNIALVATLLPGSAPLAEATLQAVVRIVQEGLTNIVRHAGASRVDLVLARRGAGLHLSLADNGRGADGRVSPEAGCGLGLAGMAERVAALGGQLEFDCPAGGGFRLIARLPLDQTLEKSS